MFVIQMKNAILTYISDPKVESVTYPSVNDLLAPDIHICPLNQENLTSFEEDGYANKKGFLNGINTYYTNLTWGGADNRTFAQTATVLFQANLTGNKVHGNSCQYVTKFLLPYGFCSHVVNCSFDPENGRMRMKLMTEAKIIVSDPRAALYHRFPGEAMRGQPLVIDGLGRKFFYTISAEQFIMDASCTDYGADGKSKSLAECAEAWYWNIFHKLIGCMPPWLSNTNTCTGFVKYPENKKEYVEVVGEILYNSRSSTPDQALASCLKPCKKTLFSSMLSSTENLANLDRNMVNLYFESPVRVHQNVRSYGEFQLVVEIGSALGLWLGWSMISIYDVLIDALKIRMCQ